MDAIIEAMRERGALLIYRADKGWGLRYPNGGYTAITRDTYCVALRTLPLRIVHQAFGQRDYEIEQAQQRRSGGDGG